MSMVSLFDRLRVSGIILLVFTSTACQQVRSQTQRVEPLPQDPFVEVYFNHSQASEYVEPYRNQRRGGDNLEQVIVDAIASSNSTVDVAVQEFRLPEIAQALATRKKAGVKVRVIVENTYNRTFSSFTVAEVEKMVERERDRLQELRQLLDQNRDDQITTDEINQRDALAILKNAGIPIIDDTADGSKGSSLMHHKFVVIDGQKVIVTSANFTMSDIHGDFKAPSSLGNANNLLKITSPEVADLFTQEFNIMWGDGVGGQTDSKFGVKKTYRSPQEIKLLDTTVMVQFSPTSARQPWETSSNGLIGKTLLAATESIDMALFVFSDQRLSNSLEVTHQKGVQIRALIDPGFAYRSYSEGLDMMGVAIVNQCKYEPHNRPWQNPISSVGVPQLLRGDLLHHKFGVIDGKIIITGSHNWSVAADRNNDEAVLIVQSPTVAAHFKREFERLYGNATLGIPEWMEGKIKAQQQQCTLTPNPSPIEGEGRIGEGRIGEGRIGEGRIGEGRIGEGRKVNLNTASLAELETLPGVGPKLAQSLVRSRQQKPFKSLEDLDKVPGVGSSLLEKLRDRVTW